MKFKFLTVWTLVLCLCCGYLTNICFAQSKDLTVVLKTAISYKDKIGLDSYLSNLSTEDYRELLKLAATKVDNGELNLSDLLIFVNTCYDKLFSMMNFEEFSGYMDNSNLSESFKQFIADGYKTFNLKNPIDSSMYNEVLEKLILSNKIKMKTKEELIGYTNVSERFLNKIIKNNSNSGLLKSKAIINFESKDESKAENYALMLMRENFTNKEGCESVLLTILGDTSNIKIQNYILDYIKDSFNKNGKISDAMIQAISNIKSEEALNVFLNSVTEKNNPGVVNSYIDNNKSTIEKIEKKDNLNSSITIKKATTYANNDDVGYAVYRDGVLGGEWHAGIIADATGKIVEASGDDPNMGAVSYSKFKGKDNFKGVYTKSGASRAVRGKVANTSIAVKNASPSYCFTTMLRHNKRTGKIAPSNITEIRCDGVVEYSYEYNGLQVQVGYDSVGKKCWDISDVYQASQHLYTWGVVAQANSLTKVRSNF